VLDLHDLPRLGLGTEEILVEERSPLVGKRISDVIGEHEGVYVLGLRRDAQLHKWHDISDGIRAEDILVALGTPDHLSALARICAVVELRVP
jgi:K+/H+ antiporter YhaU regulatory subunit KhtT